MSQAGDQTARDDGPERKCIATGQSQPLGGLIRFVLDPDGNVVPDLAGKLPGRGMWVSADRAALEKATSKGLFARSAKAPAKAAADLPDLVDRLLARRVVDLISLSRKSGDAVTGYERVKDWLQTEQARVLIQAEDGSERGKSRLSTPHRGYWIGWLTADELGLAFGRQSVIHAALRAGGLTERVVEEAQRLKGMRVASGGAGRGGKGRRKG
jgi:Predicted nucleic-acid-binding protein implicated in transcription termination